MQRNRGEKEHSAGIVIYREKDGERFYLILHYPSGHFDLPKGHIEGEETEKEAAIRELQEETGITQIELKEGYREMIEYQFRHQGILIKKDVVFFLGETDEEKVTISHEHQGSIWLPYKEAYEKLTFLNAKQLVEKAENYINKQ